MADLRDDRVSRAYDDLPDDGPAPAIDAAIQAAARRAVGARPGAARRWQIPLSIAAVLTLAVGLSLQVERAQREADQETAIPAARSEATAASPAAPVAGAAADSAAAPARESPGRATTTIKSAAEPRVKSLALPTAPAPAVAPAPVPALPESASGEGNDPTASRARAPARLGAAAERSATSGLVQELGKPAQPEADGVQTAEQQLEHIAELRAKGRHEEAERELAAFRRAFPDYRISAEWRRKVERPDP